jgi:DNA-binding NtrC family response regulator
MQNILILDDDRECRDKMAEIFTDAGFSVTATSSVSSAIHGIIKKLAQVVVLGTKCEEMPAVDLIPIVRQCNPKMPIILIATELSLGLLRKLRGEGIFYHALKPVNAADREELRQAVACAFDNLRPRLT